VLRAARTAGALVRPALRLFSGTELRRDFSTFFEVPIAAVIPPELETKTMAIAGWQVVITLEGNDAFKTVFGVLAPFVRR
jgi:hypothetical protein